MGRIQTDIETSLLDLLTADGFGDALEIDGEPVSAIFAPDRGYTLAASLQGLGQERYRLVCRRADFDPVGGQEVRIGRWLPVDPVFGTGTELHESVWTVVSVHQQDLLNDIGLERYL